MSLKLSGQNIIIQVDTKLMVQGKKKKSIVYYIMIIQQREV